MDTYETQMDEHGWIRLLENGEEIGKFGNMASYERFVAWYFSEGKKMLENEKTT